MATEKSTKRTAVKKEMGLISLDKLDGNKLEILDGVLEKQNAVVKQFPFVAIVDKETYDKAKEHRTALLTASTDLEKEEKKASSFIDAFKKTFKSKFASLAGITREKYDEQQKEVKRYEAILQEERETRQREKEEADQKVRDQIEEIENQMVAKIDHMTYDNISDVNSYLVEIISERTGTFEEFDILFDHAVEKVNAKFHQKSNTLHTEFESAEEKRKEDHKSMIKTYVAESKELIFNCTFSTIEQVKEEIVSIFMQKRDFQEFKNDVDEARENVFSLYQEARERLVSAENKRIQDEKDAEEFAALKKQNQYMKRVIDLQEIGMIKQENGDMMVMDIIYQKQFIESDSEEIFNGSKENIKNQVDIKNTPVVDAEIIADEPESVVNHDPKAIESHESLNESEELAPAEILEENEIINEIPDWENDFIQVTPPAPLENMDAKDLYDTVVGYINELSKPADLHQIKNYKNAIFETAVKTIYGDEIFEFINARLK